MYGSGGKIITTSSKIPAKHTLYHIFLFRDRWLMEEGCIHANTRKLDSNTTFSHTLVKLKLLNLKSEPKNCASWSVQLKCFRPHLGC